MPCASSPGRPLSIADATLSLLGLTLCPESMPSASQDIQKHCFVVALHTIQITHSLQAEDPYICDSWLHLKHHISG